MAEGRRQVWRSRGVATWPSISRYRTVALREAPTTLHAVGTPPLRDEIRDLVNAKDDLSPMASAPRPYAPVEVGTVNALRSLQKRLHRCGTRCAR